MENMLHVWENGAEVAQNDRARGLPLYQFREFGGVDKFGSTGIEIGVHNFSLRALQRKPRVSAISLVPWQ